MQHSHAAPFERKPPADPDVQPERPRNKKWACDACGVGKVVGHTYWGREQLDVEGCRACAGIADFFALEDDVQCEQPYQLGFDRGSPMWWEFFTKTPSTFQESKTELKLRADPSPSTSSAQAFDTLRRWIETCETKHALCKESLPKQLPRRILKIESIKPLTVRVVENDVSSLIGQQAPPYACLSYRWGEDTKINSLNKANLAVYTDRVPIERLYPLVEDAITAAWKLDLKYIWIDAYCIIQDDDDDWSHEAAKMGDIYENAFITLSATPTNNKGRLFSHIHTRQLGYPVTEHEGAPVFIRRCLEHPRFTARGADGEFFEWVGDYDGRDRFTHQRGWVFQERMLSTRVVHFLRGELFWECRERTWCECRSDEERWEGRRVQVPRTIESMEWAELIRSYCETEFSKEPDRLQALASVAKRYGAAHGKTYLAGMWFEDLPSTFLWMAHVSLLELKPRPLGCSAPSWSWTLHSAQEQFSSLSVYLNGHPPKPPCTLNFLGYNRNPPVDDVYADSHSIRLTIAGPTVPGIIFPRDRCVVILGSVWQFFPDFDMRPNDPFKYRVVEEGSEVLILLCRGTEDDCVILQGVDVRLSSNDLETDMFERIGKLSRQVYEKDELASLTDELRRCLSSDGVDRHRWSHVNGQRFRDEAKLKTITLI